MSNLAADMHGSLTRKRTKELSLLELDLLLESPSYLVAPHSVNHRLREEDPVHWSDEWSGWMVSRYSDVKAVLEDTQSFSSATQISRRLEHLLRDFPGDARAQLMEFWGFQGLFQSDPPSYTRYRSQMIKTLTPRLERVEPRVHELADELLGRIAERGQCEFVADFASVVPATILFELLGIEVEKRPVLLAWADTLTQTFADSTGRRALDATETLQEAYAWARSVTGQRRESPGDDIISLILASDTIGAMNERDVLSTVIFLLTAGQGTLASLIPTCVYLLLKHPEQLDAVKNDETLVARAIEETLRFESPIQQLGRTAVGEITIADRRVKDGELVFAMIGAGNRDPDRFEDPDRFDIQRDASRHLAFGYGAHFCLGASLARLEARVVIPLVLQRLRNLRLDGEIVWQPNAAFRHPLALPLAFD